jgi:hypothetical protein
VEEIERKALDLISTEEDKRIQHTLTELFRQEARREENKSLNVWDENKKWLKDLPSKDNVEDYLLKTNVVKPTHERSTQTTMKQTGRKPSFADVVKTTDNENVSKTNYDHRSNSSERRPNFGKKSFNPAQRHSQSRSLERNNSPINITYNGAEYTRTIPIKIQAKSRSNSRKNLNFRSQNFRKHNFVEEDGDLNHRYKQNHKQNQNRNQWWNQRS